MKKYIVSAILIVTFSAYAFYVRSKGTATIVNPSQAPVTGSGKYKDGTYTGTTEDAFYGPVQVKAVIEHGQITDVIFLQYPNDQKTSIQVSNAAMPPLRQEAITAQSADVDIVSGATQTSEAFVLSLKSALKQAGS